MRLQVCEKLGLSYKDSRSLNQVIDELPGNAPWQTSTFTVDHQPSGTKTEHTLHFRDPVECVKYLYSNPVFVDHMKFAPERHFFDEEMEHRVYNEMNTGDWWWETQVRRSSRLWSRRLNSRFRVQTMLPDGATVLPLVFSSDKTQLTNFNGEEAAYPVYLGIGNISKALRRKPSYHAQVLIGYLPTPDLTHLPDDVSRVIRARMFHKAMSIIMKPLKVAGEAGLELTSGDGAVRMCHPILACYVADYPEQSLVCCTRLNSRCPKCHAVAKDFQKHSLNWQDREQGSTLKTLRRAAKLSVAAHKENVLKDAGLTHVEDPFWAELPFCDIHESITPDILHQLYQGMFDHLVAWVTDVVGKDELDARFKRLPEAFGLRHFSNGISGLTRVSGREHKEMAKQLLGCMVGKASSATIRASRALLDFIFIAQYQSHTDDTLRYLTEALDEFHKNKAVFSKEAPSGTFGMMCLPMAC